MFHSTLTSKGQTTIPGQVRDALRLKPGDIIAYEMNGDSATIRVHPGTQSLKGVLASGKGAGLDFSQIRTAAAARANRKRRR